MTIILSYLAFSSWVFGLILLFASMQYEAILQKYKVFPNDVKLKDHPWGFKNRELLKILESTDIYEVKVKLRKAIRLRKLGYLLLITTPVSILLNSLFLN